MKGQKKQQTRQLFIDAAKQIVLSDGHAAITVRRVADITGYTYPILYHYFKDLNALYWDLRLNMIEDMIKALTEVPVQTIESINSPIDDPLKEILQSFLTYCDYFFDHPNVFRFFYFHDFIKPEGNEDYAHLEQRFAEMWQGTFSRLIAANYMKSEDVAIVAKTLIYAIQGMIMLSLSSNGSLTQEEIHVELEMLVQYLFKQEQRRSI
jgi:AcrR family transcriptional regulator